VKAYALLDFEPLREYYDRRIEYESARDFAMILLFDSPPRRERKRYLPLNTGRRRSGLVMILVTYLHVIVYSGKTITTAKILIGRIMVRQND